MPLMQTISIIATWLISILVFLLILWRPWRVPEYAWAAGGAVLLVGLRLLSPAKAWSAVQAGTSVYLFLAGMMLLTELARQHGVFDWLAAIALERSHGSQLRLFTLIYLIGFMVTALLSNDATAVLLTPAVLAVVRRTRTSPLPYLFICAFVANATSFFLPISNPANLVVFDGKLPTLAEWMRLFLAPAATAILSTFLLLWQCSRRDLRLPLEDGVQPASLNKTGRRAGIGILLAAAALLTTSAMGGRVGVAAAISGVAVMLMVAGANGRMMLAAFRKISWGILPLVAGLFVIVEALNGVGVLSLAAHALHTTASWPPIRGVFATAFGVGIVANAINNLPTGLLGAAAIKAVHGSAGLHAAVLLGIDLGPNLCVTGSLATILWLTALRRENIAMSGWRFLKTGMLIMPVTLLAAALVLALTLR